jgi:uncharacterized protein (TIGR02271 family)
MPSRQAERDVTIPVVVETPVIGTSTVETGRVRVHKHVVREPVELEAEAAREEVLVERVPFDCAVDGPLPVRTEGDVTIVPVVEEIVVVEKRFVLREEIRLTKRRTTRSVPVRSEARREVVTVERIPSQKREPGGTP